MFRNIPFLIEYWKQNFQNLLTSNFYGKFWKPWLFGTELNFIKYEPWQEISYNVVCATSKGSGQPAQSLEYSMIVKLLTEHHLEFLSSKVGCTGSSESTLVKMPHCWKSHVTAHMVLPWPYADGIWATILLQNIYSDILAINMTFFIFF